MRAEIRQGAWAERQAKASDKSVRPTHAGSADDRGLKTDD